MKHVGEFFGIKMRPRTRLVLSMSPYLPIDKNEDGMTGGGIRLRVYGAGAEVQYLDVVWGESSEIEVTL